MSRHTRVSPRAIARVSFACLCIGLLVGALAVSIHDRSHADAQSAKPPEAQRTAYVDFLSLLKDDALLKGRQEEVAEDVERQSEEIDRKWRGIITEYEIVKKNNKPDTRLYRKAMQDQVDAARKAYAEKLTLEQYAQADLRDYAIERFTELRKLCAEVALSMGYNEVLNIVRNIRDVSSGGQDDFQALQQQLLVSPVLYFDPQYDITDIVAKRAEEKWGSKIVVKEVTFTLDGATEALKPNAEGEIEIRLGQKGRFSGQVLEHEVLLKSDDPRAQLRYFKRGLGVGQLSADGIYEAPATAPGVGGDTFTVTARSVADGTRSISITVRLLDAEGKRISPETPKKE